MKDVTRIEWIKSILRAAGEASRRLFLANSIACSINAGKSQGRLGGRSVGKKNAG